MPERRSSERSKSKSKSKFKPEPVFGREHSSSPDIFSDWGMGSEIGSIGSIDPNLDSGFNLPFACGDLSSEGENVDSESAKDALLKMLETPFPSTETETESGFEKIDYDTNSGNLAGFVACRRYDISITYDNYYRTPRVWLKGQNEFGTPMNSHEIFEDIMDEYKNRTVTLERHPYFSGGLHVSIHPCKHADTMKLFIKMSNLQPHMYMFTFLKFVGSVVPTINYDFTGYG